MEIVPARSMCLVRKVLVKGLIDLPASSIIIPDTDTSPDPWIKQRVVEILAVGPKCTEVAVGDIVSLDGMCNTFANWENSKKLMIREQDIATKLSEVRTEVV